MKTSTNFFSATDEFNPFTTIGHLWPMKLVSFLWDIYGTNENCFYFHSRINLDFYIRNIILFILRMTINVLIVN